MSPTREMNQLLESVFGDDESPLLRERSHAPECEDLRQLRELKRILSDHGHREPLEGRRLHLWSRLQHRLDEAPVRRRFAAVLPSRAALMGAATVAVIACAAIAYLRISGSLQLPAVAPTPAVRSEIEAGDRLDQLIARSAPLLMAVSNRNPGDELQAIDIRSEQRLATRLADESRALREASGDGSLTRRDRMLIAELEAVLMQVANCNPLAQSGEVALLRETIENRQLLFEFALRELRGTAVAPGRERSRDV